MLQPAACADAACAAACVDALPCGVSTQEELGRLYHDLQSKSRRHRRQLVDREAAVGAVCAIEWTRCLFNSFFFLCIS